MKKINHLILASMIFTGLSFVSCKKKSLPETNNPNPTPNNTITDTTTNYFLFADIDGVSWNTGDTSTRFYSQTQFIGWYVNPTPNLLQLSYYAYFMHKDAVGPNDFTYGQMLVILEGYSYPTTESEIDCNTFHSSLSNTLTDFYSTASPDQPGLEIVYLDSNGEMWTSSIGDQTGSNFEITYNQEANPVPTGFQSCSRKYRGTFNCKVYKESNLNQYKVISNGLFHAHINNYKE